MRAVNMARRVLTSVGSGLVVGLLASLLAWLGCIMVIGGVIIPVAGVLGVRDPVMDNLTDSAIQTLYAAILVVTLGAGLAAGIYSALKAE